MPLPCEPHASDGQQPRTKDRNGHFELKQAAGRAQGLGPGQTHHTASLQMLLQAGNHAVCAVRHSQALQKNAVDRNDVSGLTACCCLADSVLHTFVLLAAGLGDPEQHSTMARHNGAQVQHNIFICSAEFPHTRQKQQLLAGLALHGLGNKREMIN